MKTLAVQQRSAAWYEARRGIPTASRFEKILSPIQGRRSYMQVGLIAELIAESVCPPDEGLIPTHTNAEMEYGMKLEAEARCAYELEHAAGKVREVGFVLHDSGMFGCSPDALVDPDGGVEIKCPSPATHIQYVMAGELPDKYKAQVHGSMVATGRAWWDFWSYCRHFDPFLIRVERDDFTAKLEAELLAFCARYNEVRKRFGLRPLAQPAAT